MNAYEEPIVYWTRDDSRWDRLSIGLDPGTNIDCPYDPESRCWTLDGKRVLSVQESKVLAVRQARDLIVSRYRKIHPTLDDDPVSTN